MTEQTTYGQLVNGDRVYICGYCFTVTNIRTIEDWTPLALTGRPGPGRGVVRFEGIAQTGSDIEHTGYNGGTYGAYVHVPVTREINAM